MKNFKEYISEVKSASLWDFLYRKNKGVFWRGEGKGGKGTELGALGAGIYLTWSESMAGAFANRLGSGGTVKKYQVKRGLKIADNRGDDFQNILTDMGFGRGEYGGDKMFANLMKTKLSRLGYDGAVSDDVAEGIVIFDKKNVKLLK